MAKRKQLCTTDCAHNIQTIENIVSGFRYNLGANVIATCALEVHIQCVDLFKVNCFHDNKVMLTIRLVLT